MELFHPAPAHRRTGLRRLAGGAMLLAAALALLPLSTAEEDGDYCPIEPATLKADVAEDPARASGTGEGSGTPGSPDSDGTPAPQGLEAAEGGNAPEAEDAEVPPPLPPDEVPPLLGWVPRPPPPGSSRRGRFPHLSPYDLETLERKGVRIIAINVVCVDMFDPSVASENRKLYRWMNKLHVTTREKTIRHQLLFAVGQPIVKSRLEETERNLRALPFIQDASVEVTDVNEKGATVSVKTSDVWSTRLSFRIASSGGKGTGGAALSERNLLGWGKGLEIRYFVGVDRTTSRYIYKDYNLFGSKLNLQLSHINASDGGGNTFFLQRPFLSLEDPLAWAVGGLDITSLFPFYRDTELIQEFHHEVQDGTGSFTWSRPVGGDRSFVRRLSAGYLYHAADFSPEGPLQPGLTPDEVPQSDTISGPTFTWALVRQDLLKTHNFERFSRWEDFDLGGALTVRLQPSLTALGATQDQLVTDLTLSRGLRTGPQGVLLANADLLARLGTDGQGVGHLDLTHYYTGWPRQTLFARLGADAGVNLLPQGYFFLGGDTGLHGYKLRSFDGTKRILLNVEDRVRLGQFTRLFYFGVAGFVDVGNAWGGSQLEVVCDSTGGAGARAGAGTASGTWTGSGSWPASAAASASRKSSERGSGAMATPPLSRWAAGAGRQDAPAQALASGCRYVAFDNTFGNLKADIGVALLADVVKASSAGFLRLNLAWPINGSKYDQGKILISFGQQADF